MFGRTALAHHSQVDGETRRSATNTAHTQLLHSPWISALLGAIHPPPSAAEVFVRVFSHYLIL